MAWVSQQVGVIDGRGCVFCMAHANHAKGEAIPQYADNSAMDLQTCDAAGCEAVFTRQRNPDANGTPEQPPYLFRWIRAGRVIADHSKRVQEGWRNRNDPVDSSGV